MYIKTVCNIGDIIYMYDPEDDSEREKVIDNIIIAGEPGKLVTNKDIILRADAHDDVICTYDKLINSLPDEGGIYYFRCEKSRKLYKEAIKERKING